MTNVMASQDIGTHFKVKALFRVTVRAGIAFCRHSTLSYHTEQIYVESLVYVCYGLLVRQWRMQRVNRIGHFP